MAKTRPDGTIRPVKRAVPVAAALIVVTGVWTAVAMSGAATGSPRPSSAGIAGASGASVPPSTGTAAGGPAGSSPGSSSPVPAPASPSVPATIAAVPIVPVAQFRTTVESVTRGDVAAALAGTSRTFDGLELVEGDADAVLAALRASRPADASRLTLAPDATTLRTDLAAHRKRLGILRAVDVDPSVRALGWDGRFLFGAHRARANDAWGLTAQLPSSGAGFDPSTTWTLVAGGDIMLDRGVAQTLTVKGKGADFPFDGGTADITGTCRNCSPLGWDTPYTKRTGNAGAVRDLIKSADLAIANFENPAPDAFRYHTRGTVFSANPKLIAGLAYAGIDWVGIANNHIRDAGGVGILQTIANLRKQGIATSGAGANLAAARKPTILTVDGVKVAFLAYDTIAKSYAATATRAGSAQMSAKVLRTDVAAARTAGAQLVIVFPHWGTEYDPTPFAGQQALAHAAIDAGADLVIGNHAHWAGAVEVYEGKPIWYALGNFVFDQTWSIPTMEGVTLELTFRGATLVQARMRPHIILDKAQPNFLDPAGDGRMVLGQVYDASKGMLPW
jgi:hypothetical protein